MTERVLILDFGSQVTQLIARRVRESGVYCEILPYNADPARIAEFAPRAVILSGGPASVTTAETPRAPAIVFELGVPLLGICYGYQTLCAQLGGAVEPSEHQEFGRAFLEVTGDCMLFDGLWKPGDRAQVWMSHGDRVIRPPRGFRVVGFASCGPAVSGPAGFAGEVYTLYVLPDWQERGVGRALLGACFAALRSAGLGSALIWVLADNPSRFFYEAMGGTRVGERDETLWGVVLHEAAYGWPDLAAK